MENSFDATTSSPRPPIVSSSRPVAPGATLLCYRFRMRPSGAAIFGPFANSQNFLRVYGKSQGVSALLWEISSSRRDNSPPHHAPSLPLARTPQ